MGWHHQHGSALSEIKIDVSEGVWLEVERRLVNEALLVVRLVEVLLLLILKLIRMISEEQPWV